MQKCTYVASVACSSQEGPSSSRESDVPLNHLGADISSPKNSTHNSNSEGCKVHTPGSTLPQDKNNNVRNPQGAGKGGGEVPAKVSESNAPTAHLPQQSKSQKVCLTRTVVSKALCAIAKTTEKVNSSPVQPRTLYRPRRAMTKDRPRNERGPCGGILREGDPQGPGREEDQSSNSVSGSNETVPPSSTTSAPSDGVKGSKDGTEPDDERPHLPPVTTPYVRQQYPTRRCNSATPTIRKMLASSDEERRNNKDGPLSGRTALRALGPGTATSTPPRNIPLLGLQGCSISSPVKDLGPPNSESRLQKDVSAKPDEEGVIFFRSENSNTFPAHNGSKNKPTEAFVKCASEVHRLYRNILVNRPRSPLPFIIDQLHQQLEHKSHHDALLDEECKTIGREVRFIEEELIQEKISAKKEPTSPKGSSSHSHNLSAQPEGPLPEVYVPEVLHINKPLTPVLLSAERGNDIVFEEPKAPDNSSLLQVPALHSAEKYDRHDNGIEDLSKPGCANCDIMCRRQPTFLVVTEKGEEALPNSTSDAKPPQSYVTMLSGSTYSSSTRVRSSAPPSWIVGTSPLWSVSNTASLHPDCAPPLPHSNLTQRGFGALSRMVPSQATTATAVLPVFGKRASLTGSTMAAGSALDVRSSGSDISSVFSVAPVDVQEMLRELRIAKEAHVGTAQTHVSWNELVDILERVSFPAHDAMLLADLFDELWMNQHNREQKLAADRQPVVSGCSSPTTPHLWSSGALGCKQHNVCSPFDGNTVYSVQGNVRSGFSRVQGNPDKVQNAIVEAMRGLATSEKKAASSKTLQDPPPIPTVRFETFLACMTYKIQGRYPLEVIRQAFFDLVEKYGVTHDVTSDAVSHKLGLVLESLPTPVEPFQPAKETESHARKLGSGSVSRGKSNDISFACGYHDRGEGVHPPLLTSCTTEQDVTLDLSNITDANPDKPSGNQTKGQERGLSTKSLHENAKETSSPHNSSIWASTMREGSHMASNFATHIDFMGSITSSSRLFSPHLTVMAQTVPLRMCVVEGIQGLLGLSNFDGADIEQALNMAGQPMHNLDYHCHLDEFIRLVHCVTMLVNRKLMNSNNYSKGGHIYPTLIRTPASVTASGNVEYNCSSNNMNSMSRSENEGNPVMFSLNVNYAAR